MYFVVTDLKINYFQEVIFLSLCGEPLHLIAVIFDVILFYFLFSIVLLFLQWSLSAFVTI